VLVTVILHGFSLKPLAQLLGITSADPDGFLIIGSNRFSLALAEKLKGANLPVLIADRNHSRLSAARQAGFTTYLGEILSEAAEHRLDLSRYGTLIAATDNDAYNALVCTDFGPELGRARVFRLGVEEGKRDEIATTLSGQRLFNPSMGETEAEFRMITNDWAIQRTKLTEEFTMEALRAQRDPATQVMFAVSAKGEFISPALGAQFKPAAGDTVFLFGPPPPQEIQHQNRNRKARCRPLRPPSPCPTARKPSA
jgi:hypothetical protein